MLSGSMTTERERDNDEQNLNKKKNEITFPSDYIRVTLIKSEIKKCLYTLINQYILSLVIQQYKIYFQTRNIHYCFGSLTKSEKREIEKDRQTDRKRERERAKERERSELFVFTDGLGWCQGEKRWRGWWKRRFKIFIFSFINVIQLWKTCKYAIIKNYQEENHEN